jgi:hypothetical protein
MRHLHFHADALREAERPYVRSLSSTLVTLEMSTDDFMHSIGLFGNMHNQLLSTPEHQLKDALRAWSFIGAKYGAVILGGALETFQIIQGELLHKTPFIREHMDRQKMRQARKLFDVTFPNIKLVRADAAHPGELAATPERFDDHKSDDVPPPIAVNCTGMYLSGCIVGGPDGNRYACTVNGKYASYPLTVESIETFKRAVGLYIDAFEPAAVATEVAVFGRSLRTS